MRVFLSAVTAQFKACRDALRSDLAAIGCEVKVQEDFQTGPRTLLERLEEYVAGCDRVIALVGDAYGFEASGDAVLDGAPPRSYTQWEYGFARGERLDGQSAEPKPMYVYLASDQFLRTHTAAQSEVEASKQRAFVAGIKASGKHWAAFDSLEGLCRLVLRDGWSLNDRPRPPVDAATLQALAALRESVVSAPEAAEGAAGASEEIQARVLRHAPRTNEEFCLHRIAAWSQPRFALDKRFTRLTLLVDQGRDADGGRWQVRPESFDDLRDVLAAVAETAPAVVVLGPPGSGKSTLLRRLELDVAAQALRGSESADGWTMFVRLGSYRAASPKEGLPAPEAWLTAQWSREFPHLPAFDVVLRSGRLVLLLDALNEMPHATGEDYRERVGLWRELVADVVRRAPGTRVVISCRSLDYSEQLSTAELSVPHVRIERLSDEQVESFLLVCSPDHGGAMWRNLKGTPQLDLFRSPFYLKLLVGEAGPDGALPSGRAALFTRFLRQALDREVRAKHPLFEPGVLFDAREHARVVNPTWRDAYDVPARGPLVPALSSLAVGMQQQRTGGEGAQVRVPLDIARVLLGGSAPDRLLEAGVALQVLDDDRARDEVLFVHQLLQEYFAARAIAATAPSSLADRAQLAATPWHAPQLPPPQFESDNDPLPPAPQTGWEETFVLAAAMTVAEEGTARGSASADAFIHAVTAANLPLAGRCAAQPDVRISEVCRSTLTRDLLARSCDSKADLRARIAAARALGELGDPRFARQHGPHGDYLQPPLVAVSPGVYRIGRDDGPEDERPAHDVSLGAFAIARFPVTNAEWSLFMQAGGYEDDRWWQTEAARRWRLGEGTGEGPKSQLREERKLFQEHFDRIPELQRQGRMTSAQAEAFQAIARMDDAAFEELLKEWYPTGRYTQPDVWNDPAFNHSSQPVVGVGWHEARAYCAWLSAQTGQAWRLPTEAEWESAARGRKARPFPWGQTFEATRCNTFEGHVRGTTPVGVFPTGDTPEGIADMAGNVWEWTSSAYETYRYDAKDGRENPGLDGVRRVLRGGSWYYSQDYARATSRLNLVRDSRLNHIGFRVVCVSPIP